MNRTFPILVLFIAFKSLIISAQTYCDSNKLPWVLTDIMPSCNISAEELELMLNRDVPLKKYTLENGKGFSVRLILNCKGEGFNYKVLNSDNEIFNKVIIDCISNNTKWSPAYILRNKKMIPVDFGITLGFKIQNEKIVYLDNEVVIYKKHHYFIKRELKKNKIEYDKLTRTIKVSCLSRFLQYSGAKADPANPCTRIRAAVLNYNSVWG
jgi:hypothetical protein